MADGNSVFFVANLKNDSRDFLEGLLKVTTMDRRNPATMTSRRDFVLITSYLGAINFLFM